MVQLLHKVVVDSTVLEEREEALGDTHECVQAAENAVLLREGVQGVGGGAVAVPALEHDTKNGPSGQARLRLAAIPVTEWDTLHCLRGGVEGLVANCLVLAGGGRKERGRSLAGGADGSVGQAVGSVAGRSFMVDAATCAGAGHSAPVAFAPRGGPAPAASGEPLAPAPLAPAPRCALDVFGVG